MHVVPNKDAVGFYRKCGYSVVEVEEDKPMVMRKIFSE
jgi:hypothetical protein